MARFIIDADQVNDASSFHLIFQETMKFFDGYGRNMDAWIDCMTDLHGPAALSGHTLTPGEGVELHVLGSEGLGRRCFELFRSFVECTAAANRRYERMGSSVRIALVLE